MAKKTVLGFGEVLWDLLPAGRQLGGAPLNFIYRVCCLGDRGLIASRLGRDELGDDAYTQILELGMDPSLVQRDPTHPTGTVPVTFDAAGQPDYEIVPDVAYDYIEPEQALIAAADRADCLCFGTLAQRSEASRRTCRDVLRNANHAVKLLDINLRRRCYERSIVEASLESADIVKVNEAEAAELSTMLDLQRSDVDAIAASLIDRYGLRCCIVTAGEAGSLAISSQPQTAYAPGFVAPAGGDPVGAGDGFTAGFIHKLLRDEPLEACLRFGNAVGALVAGQVGGTAPLTSAAVDAFLASDPQRNSNPKLAALAG